jgi:hypothetical protein
VRGISEKAISYCPGSELARQPLTRVKALAAVSFILENLSGIQSAGVASFKHR